MTTTTNKMPTLTQANALEAVANGGIYRRHYMGWFQSSGISGAPRGVGLAFIDRLKSFGWVMDGASEIAGTDIKITDSGRAALARYRTAHKDKP